MTLKVAGNYLKIYHARQGYNNVFGKDVDRRNEMDDSQLIERFDDVWKNSLCHAVERADRCDPEDARRKLKPKQQPYLDGDQEHREFWLENGLFIAQLKPINENDRELTQLWFISSTNIDPRVLRITFDTVDFREEFSQLAHRLGYTDEKLGEKLLLDFMGTILRKTFTGES